MVYVNVGPVSWTHGRRQENFFKFGVSIVGLFDHLFVHRLI